MAISKAAKAAYDRERYRRLGPRQQTRDRAAKAEYDRQRYAARRAAMPDLTCAGPGCATILPRNRRGGRLYCSDACRQGAFYGVHAEARQPMPRPYTGHQWLDRAREAVNPAQTEFGWELYDRYNDEMGEAVLALLEGGNPEEAVKAFRKREFIPRHLTTSISEWQSDPEMEYKMDGTLPSAPSAEEEAVARETVVRRIERLPVIPRTHMGKGKGFMGTSRQQAPAQRRQRVA